MHYTKQVRVHITHLFFYIITNYLNMLIDIKKEIS